MYKHSDTDFLKKKTKLIFHFKLKEKKYFMRDFRLVRIEFSKVSVNVFTCFYLR